jgi:hypothetical protein
MLRKTPLLLAFLALVLSFGNRANAGVIATLPDYDGTASFGPFPSTLAIGDFTFSIPTGYTVIGATISGTFGNNDVPGTTDTSAPADLFVDGGTIEVAECDDALSFTAACDAGSSPTAWSYIFTPSDLSNLGPEFAAGSVDLSAIQNDVFAVNLGSLTLDIQAVPEPNTLLLLGSAMAAFALLRRLHVR